MSSIISFQCSKHLRGLGSLLECSMTMGQSRKYPASRRMFRSRSEAHSSHLARALTTMAKPCSAHLESLNFRYRLVVA
jgi:hypothetical protein